MAQVILSNKNMVLAVAGIAADLHSVMKVAWGVSLAAKNAKVISAQAGEKALGFQPITNFIDEIAQQSIDGVNEINREALKLSRLTVSEYRANDAYLRFNKVLSNRTQIRYIDSLDAGVKEVTEKLQHTRMESRACINRLSALLEAMNECMLSAYAIASVSRIVTSNIDGYRENLLVVADNLEEAATYIKNKISESNAVLERVSKSWQMSWQGIQN